MNPRHPLPCIIAVAALAPALMLACHSKAASDPSANTVNPASAVTNNVAENATTVKTIFNDPELDRKAEAWADSVLDRLSARRRIAQLFVPRLDIVNNKAGYQKLTQVVIDEQMGGFLLGKGSLACYIDLINKGQAGAQIPLMITFDGEWGLSMRIPGTPRFPRNMALGAADNEELMYAYGKEMARECKLMGIQVNFAPDIDVNSNPDNPVIGYRSFGEDPELVGRLGAAYCRGMADGAVMPVGKHFPGHGDTSVDSHKALPHIDHSLSTLRDVDMRPFVMAFDAGMPAVMVGHLKVPALDKSGVPSSLSDTITTFWLRDSLGFSGLVFTDALAMKGAVVSGENNCVSAFLAGADILLGSTDPVADLNAVEAAVKAGKIDQEEIDACCHKILKYKYKLGLDRKTNVVGHGLSEKLNTSYADSLITVMSRQAVTVLKNKDKVLPVKTDAAKSKVVVVNIGAPATNEFTKRCAVLAGVKSYGIESATVPAAVASAVKDADIVLLAVYKDSQWAKKTFATLAGSGKCVGVFFVNPYAMAKFGSLSKLQATVLAYDDIEHLRTAAADALFGQIPVVGKLPVNLPGIAKIGDGEKYDKVNDCK